MRFALSSFALALAADSEAPVISLNLADNKQAAKWDSMADITPSSYPASATVSSKHYTTAARDTVIKKLMTRKPRYSGPKNSFADECEVNTPAFNQIVDGVKISVPEVDRKCQEPRAAAFDHHDGDITDQMTTTYTMFVKSDVRKMPTRPGNLVTPGTAGLSNIDFAQRGEFVINYDVKDETGNAAEQVEFAMILVDEEAPFFINSPAFYAGSGIQTYEKFDTHCRDNKTCREENKNGIKKYRTYMSESVPGKKGGAATTQKNVVLELCGDLGEPAEKMGSTSRNLYWHNGDKGAELKSYDNYDGILTQTNSKFSAKGDKFAGKAGMESLESKIDVFEYTDKIDDFFHKDVLQINKLGYAKPRTMAKRDMQFPIKTGAKAQACLNEMQSGKNQHGEKFFAKENVWLKAFKGPDASGKEVTLLNTMPLRDVRGNFKCDFTKLMNNFQDTVKWAQWEKDASNKSKNPTGLSAFEYVEAKRDQMRLQCVHCIAGYREYLKDSHAKTNSIIDTSRLSGVTPIVDGVKQSAKGGSAPFTSDCWAEGVKQHQMENWFCGKPLYRYSTFQLKSQDFADIFGLNNKNNKVEEQGNIIFQDSIIPTIVLPKSNKNGVPSSFTNIVSAYECGYQVFSGEGQEYCTYDAPKNVVPQACVGHSDCNGFNGSNNNRCEKAVYGGKGYCKIIGTTNIIKTKTGGVKSKCFKSDGTAASTYWTRYLAKGTSGWKTSYRPDIKYVDCYDSHVKKHSHNLNAMNNVVVSDPLNVLDFDQTNSNWAGVEGECKKTGTRPGSSDEFPILPWRETPTDADLYKDLFGTSKGDNLFTKCVVKCTADIARVSGYASGDISHNGGCKTYCKTLAHYSGFECHSKARSITLSYDVQDNFGNWAKTKQSYVAITDNIAPTLYITTHTYREATEEIEGVLHCDSRHEQRLIEDDGTFVCHTKTGTKTRCNDEFSDKDHPEGMGQIAHSAFHGEAATGDAHYVSGHHLTVEHCDNVRFCKVNGKVTFGAGCEGQSMLGMYDHTSGTSKKNMSYHVDENLNQLLDQQIIQHSAGYAADYRWVEELLMEGTGYECWDTCSATTTIVEWHSSCADDSTESVRFDILTPGTFYLKYDCHDEAGMTYTGTNDKNGMPIQVVRKALHTTACRTFINVDKTRPVLTVFDFANSGDGTYHVEATRDTNYVDAGAACSDMVDGNLNPDVQVSGDVVNMAAVGTYIINYDCEDSAGHLALQAHRTVVVEDTTCPCCSVDGDKCEVAGKDFPTITVEASFPYSESEAVCTDNIDGEIGTATVSGFVDIELTGTYVLTYSATDMNNNAMTGDCEITKTIIVEDTMVPIISLKYRNNQLLGGQLMAEAASSNAWLIGAVASAISGVALLGYAATRKASASTTVPV